MTAQSLDTMLPQWTRPDRRVAGVVGDVKLRTRSKHLCAKLVSDGACQDSHQLRVQLHNMDVAGLAGDVQLVSPQSTQLRRLVPEVVCRNFHQLRMRLHDVDVVGLAGRASISS